MAHQLKTSVDGASGLARRVYTRVEDLESEAVDPYAMGYDAGANLDDPPACPFTNNGQAAALWRKGFSARVDEYIAAKRRWGGLNASIT